MNMVSKTLTALALGIVCSLGVARQAGAGPAIASEWADLDMAEAECFRRGEGAIKQLGFGNMERTKFSRYGQRQDYTVVVRCVEEKKIVLFLAAGPSREQAQKYQIELFRLFLKQ
jgi:hypothetical protein